MVFVMYCIDFFQLGKLSPQPNMDIDQLEFAVSNSSDVDEVQLCQSRWPAIEVFFSILLHT